MTKDLLLEALAPGNELAMIIREATKTVEDELKLEDTGWINLSTNDGVISDSERITNLKLSRLYYAKDPLARQAIRLWTDYTFGSGMAWDMEDETAKKLLKAFWEDKANQSVLSARGQRKSSDKLLVDGEVFFALFLGAEGKARIRHIDPLEITEIITDPDDKEDIKYYKRDWVDGQSKSHTSIYRSTTNSKGEPCLDANGNSVKHTDEALVYGLAYNTISRRGNPLLLPALDWIKQYRRFLASRVAVMLALARFAWRTKVKGGQTVVDNIKAKTHEQEIAAGSHILENLGSDTTPIKTESGASSAYQDGRMLKLQIAAAVGIPEQYFGDISIGNLATAKTVELPMMKMFQSYQKVWADTYQDINEVILEYNDVSPDKWYVDMDFPSIAPSDVMQVAQAIVQILQVMPDLSYADDVKQIALLTLGVNDPAQVLAQLEKKGEEKESIPEVALTRALRQFREVLNKGNGH